MSRFLSSGVIGSLLRRFTPAKLPNLAAWYDVNDRATVLSDGAANFVSANSQQLTVTNNSSLQAGDIDFCFGGWFKGGSTGNFPIGKWTTTGDQREYGMLFLSGRYHFYISSAGNNIISVDSGVGISVDWIFAICWHDSVNNTINIQINNGSIASVSHSTGVYIGNSTFALGSRVGADYFNGQMDSVFFTKRVLTSTERTWLYNSGEGRVYADMGIAGTDGVDLKTDLVSWWDLGEESGTRFDSHGTNHLRASTSSPTFASGIAAGQARDVNYARGFARTSNQYLSIPANSSLEIAGKSFTYAGWAYHSLTTPDLGIIQKGSEIGLRMRTSGTRYTCYINGGGTVETNTSTILLNQWFFYTIECDLVNNTMTLNINNGQLVASRTLTGTPSSTANDLWIGRTSTGYFDGRLDTTARWDRVLTADEKTWLFNAGKGRKYLELGVTGNDGEDLKTDLISCWDMEGAAGTGETDLHGSNHLTQSGGVTRTRGVDYYSGAVSKLLDKSGNNRHLIQNTFAARPVLVLGDDGRYFLYFDGIDDTMTSTMPSVAQPWIACMVWRKVVASGSNQQIVRFGTPFPFYVGRSDIDNSAGKLVSGLGTSRRVEASALLTNLRAGVVFANGANSFMRIDGEDWTYTTGSPGTAAATGVSQLFSNQEAEFSELMLAGSSVVSDAYKLSKYFSKKHGTA